MTKALLLSIQPQHFYIKGAGRLEGQYVTNHHAPQFYQYVYVKEEDNEL